MRDNMNCVIKTHCEQVQTKFILYYEADSEITFSVSSPGMFYDAGFLSIENIKLLGHFFTWFSEDKSLHLLKLKQDKEEVTVTLELDYDVSIPNHDEAGNKLVDIWFHFDVSSLCLGPFAIKDVHKLGGFFLECGLFGWSEAGLEHYGDPVENGFMKALGEFQASEPQAPMEPDEEDSEFMKSISESMEPSEEELEKMESEEDYLYRMFAENEREDWDEDREIYDVYKELDEVLEEMWEEEEEEYRLSDDEEV